MGTVRAWVVLSLPLLAACYTVGPADVTDQRLADADALYQSGLYYEAIRYYQYVCENRPLLKRAFVRMAHAYQLAGEPFAAMHWYEHVRDQIDSKDITVLHCLAEIYYETGFLPESADALKAILEINPRDAGAKEALRMVVFHMSHDLATPAPAVAPTKPSPPTPSTETPGGGVSEPAVDSLTTADAAIRDAAAVARRLAETDAAPDADARRQAKDAGIRLRAAVLKCRDVLRARPDDAALQRKVAMAERVLAFLDDLAR